MVFTVSQMAEISGVSVRTLHFYDEEGLLKPAYVGENGYRYYEGAQLLRLQQILFFRELKFELKEIRRILAKSGFNQLAALSSHKRVLEKELARIRRLIRTIDRTVEHVTGQKTMKDKEMFYGFSLVNRGKGTESYYEAETAVLTRVKKTDIPREEILEKTYDLFRKFVKCIGKGLKPSSAEVQKLVGEHYAYVRQFHTEPEKVYPALAQLYREHPEFRKQMEPFHQDLPDFLSEAMKIYSEKELG